MIEQIIRDHLIAVLAVPVVLEIPARLPETFVVLEKTGSGITNCIQRSTLAVQSYAPSLYQAAELNEQVKAAMGRAAALPELCAVRLNSDYNLTDTTIKRYRYQTVFDLTHY